MSPGISEAGGTSPGQHVLISRLGEFAGSGLRRGPGEERGEAVPLPSLSLRSGNLNAGSRSRFALCWRRTAASFPRLTASRPLGGVGTQMGFFSSSDPGLFSVCCRGEAWRLRDPVPGGWEGCLWGPWGQCPEALGVSAPARVGQWRGRFSCPHSIASPLGAEVESCF